MLRNAVITGYISSFAQENANVSDETPCLQLQHTENSLKNVLSKTIIFLVFTAT